MNDLGRVFSTFFKYVLGYGVLYSVIGAISQLGRAVLDLEDKLAQIRATAGLTDGERDVDLRYAEASHGKA